MYAINEQTSPGFNNDHVCFWLSPDQDTAIPDLLTPMREAFVAAMLASPEAAKLKQAHELLHALAGRLEAVADKLAEVTARQNSILDSPNLASIADDSEQLAELDRQLIVLRHEQGSIARQQQLLGKATTQARAALQEMVTAAEMKRVRELVNGIAAERQELLKPISKALQSPAVQEAIVKLRANFLAAEKLQRRDRGYYEEMRHGKWFLTTGLGIEKAIREELGITAEQPPAAPANQPTREEFDPLSARRESDNPSWSTRQPNYAQDSSPTRSSGPDSDDDQDDNSSGLCRITAEDMANGRPA